MWRGEFGVYRSAYALTAFSVHSHSLFCAFAQPFLCCTVAVLSLHHRSTSWLVASILNCENVFAVLMLCTALVQPSYHHYTTMEMRNQHVTVTEIALRNHECIAMHANAERRTSESTASALRQICWSGYFWIFQNSFGLLRPRSIVMRHHCEKCKKKLQSNIIAKSLRNGLIFCRSAVAMPLHVWCDWRNTYACWD